MTEPDNRYDPNAVQVRILGITIGYLSREDNVAYRPAIDFAATLGSHIAAPAEIRGGWDRGEGDRGSFGVVLHMLAPDGVMAELNEWARDNPDWKASNRR